MRKRIMPPVFWMVADKVVWPGLAFLIAFALYWAVAQMVGF